MTQRLRAAARAALLLSIQGTLAGAQTADAAILGRVSDPAGAPVTGVAVTAQNTATVVAWIVNTNASGRYAFVHGERKLRCADEGRQPVPDTVVVALRFLSSVAQIIPRGAHVAFFRARVADREAKHDAAVDFRV